MSPFCAAATAAAIVEKSLPGPTVKTASPLSRLRNIGWDRASGAQQLRKTRNATRAMMSRIISLFITAIEPTPSIFILPVYPLDIVGL
jgi:hypothetical protein